MRRRYKDVAQTRDRHIRAVLAGIRDLYQTGTRDSKIVGRIRKEAEVAGMTKLVNRILFGLFDIRSHDTFGREDRGRRGDETPPREEPQ